MSPVRVGIIGCGQIAHVQARSYHGHPDAELLACCDPNRGRAERFAHEFSVPRRYADAGELLADPDIDMVEIIVPHDLHCGLAQEAALAGKHVSVQKPMAMDLAEADRMIEAARKGGVLLRVLENFVFYPPYVKAKELIDAGEIGAPIAIRLKFNPGDPTGGWDEPLSTLAWRFHKDRCGGGTAIWDDGYHKFSIARWLMGDVEKVFAWIAETDLAPMIGTLLSRGDVSDRVSNPEDVAEALESLTGRHLDAAAGDLAATFGGMADSQGRPVSLAVDLPAVVTWKYRDGERYGVWDSMFSPDMRIRSEFYPVDERVEITGTKGVIWVNQCTAKLQGGAPLVMYRDGETVAFDDVPAGWQESFDAAIAHFVGCVLDGGGTEPVLSGPDAREVLRFAIAAHVSSRVGKPVGLDEVGPEDRP